MFSVYISQQLSQRDRQHLSARSYQQRQHKCIIHKVPPNYYDLFLGQNYYYHYFFYLDSHIFVLQSYMYVVTVTIHMQIYLTIV